MTARTPLEGDDEDWVAAQAMARYAVFSLHLHSAENTGWPDRLYLIPGGKPLFIEHKRKGEAPRARQRLIHARLRHAGYDVAVCDTRLGALDAVMGAVVSAKARVPPTVPAGSARRR